MKKPTIKKKQKKRVVGSTGYYVNTGYDQKTHSIKDPYKRGFKDIVFFARYFLDIEPHKEQRKWLWSSKRQINTLVPGKRFGKTFITAVKHIHQCYYKVEIGSKDRTFSDEEFRNIGEGLKEKLDYRTLNVSPHSLQAEQCYNYIIQILTSSFIILPKKRQPDRPRTNKCRLKGFLKRALRAPFLKIEFNNGSSVLIRPTASDVGRSFEGQAFGYISYDECALSSHLKTEVNMRLLPRLIDLGGRLDLISTPDPTHPISFEYHEKIYRLGLKEDQDTYYSQGGNTFDNPYIAKKDILKTEALLDPQMAKIVLYGEFADAGTSFFTFKEIRGAEDSKLKLKRIRKMSGHIYTIAVDTASTEDFFVICALDVTTKPFKIVGWSRYQGRNKAMWGHINDVATMCRKFDVQNPVIDAQSEAAAHILENLESLDLAPIPFRFDVISGVSTKHEVLANLKRMFQDGDLKFPPIPELSRELAMYPATLDDKNLKTDCVMSLGIAVTHTLRTRIDEEVEPMDVDIIL